MAILATVADALKQGFKLLVRKYNCKLADIRPGDVPKWQLLSFCCPNDCPRASQLRQLLTPQIQQPFVHRCRCLLRDI